MNDSLQTIPADTNQAATTPTTLNETQPTTPESKTETSTTETPGEDAAGQSLDGAKSTTPAPGAAAQQPLNNGPGTNATPAAVQNAAPQQAATTGAATEAKPGAGTAPAVDQQKAGATGAAVENPAKGKVPATDPQKAGTAGTAEGANPAAEAVPGAAQPQVGTTGAAATEGEMNTDGSDTLAVPIAVPDSVGNASNPTQAVDEEGKPIAPPVADEEAKKEQEATQDELTPEESAEAEKQQEEAIEEEKPVIPIPAMKAVKGSVGIDMDNLDAEIAAVQNRLRLLGVLSESDYQAEAILAPVGDTVSHDQFPKTVAAIIKFQKTAMKPKWQDGKIGSKRTPRSTLTRLTNATSIEKWEELKPGWAKDVQDQIKADEAKAAADAAKAKAAEDEETRNARLETDEGEKERQEEADLLEDQFRSWGVITDEEGLAEALRPLLKKRPKFVIDTINDTSWGDDDDVTYLILKPMTYGQIQRLPQILKDYFYDALDGGWTVDEEYQQMDRLKGIRGEAGQSTYTTDMEFMEEHFPSGKTHVMEGLVDVLNQYMSDFGITNDERFHHFMAQIGHETGEFQKMSVTENLRYTTEAQLNLIFGDYMTGGRKTKDYLKSPEKLANLVYSNRMDNGDEASGDGYKYRGRGMLQLTGKYNYTEFTKFMKDEYEETIDFVENPDHIADNIEYAVLSALWHFKVNVIDGNRCDVDNATVLRVSQIVNGTSKDAIPNGYEHRKKIYERF